MTDTERYELIRPIVLEQKTVSEVHKETGIPLCTLYCYVKRFREQGMEGLKDKSRRPHSNPQWFSEPQKDIVIQYKLSHPLMSARKIAEHLSESVMKISNHTVTNILHACGIPLRFSPSS